jgi:hypothetical protein
VAGAYRAGPPSSRWLNAHLGCLMPEQELLSIVPGRDRADFDP